MPLGGKSSSLNRPFLLLCEGQDEVKFFEAWIQEFHRTDIQVLSYDGKTKLGEALREVAKVSGFDKLKRIVITRDADESAEAAKASMRGAVEGSPLAQLNPALFVLPDNESPGSLETLWLNSLKGQPFESCIDQFFECIQGKGWEPSAAWSKNDKAKAQLWIATKEVPNERFGIAAWHGRRETEKEWMKDRWVDFNHEAFAKLKSFLVETFKN